MADIGNVLDDRFVAELAELVRHRRKNGLWGSDGREVAGSLNRAPLDVKNTETSAVPAWGCMQVDGTVDEGGRAYIKIKKPASGGLLYLFNGAYEIEASGYGQAQTGAITRAYKSTGTVTLGDRWAPTTGQWYLTKGVGQFVVLGSDDIGTDVFRVMHSPVTRLYRYTLNADWSSLTAAADILEPDGTDTGIDDTVRDPLAIFADMANGDAGWCIYQDGKYWAIQAPCPA